MGDFHVTILSIEGLTGYIGAEWDGMITEAFDRPAAFVGMFRKLGLIASSAFQGLARQGLEHYHSHQPTNGALRCVHD